MHGQGFSIVTGEEVIKSYIDHKTTSGKPLERQFCSECGSLLFAFTPLRNDIVNVAAGTLDDFGSWQPDVEQYCEHRAGFVEKIKGVDESRRHVGNTRIAREK